MGVCLARVGRPRAGTALFKLACCASKSSFSYIYMKIRTQYTMFAVHPSSQTCLLPNESNGMPFFAPTARPPAPPISLHSFRSRQQQLVLCMASQPSKSNFEARWAARQRDWRTQVAQLQRRLWCAHAPTPHAAHAPLYRESQVTQQLLVVLQPLVCVYQALVGLWQQEAERCGLCVRCRRDAQAIQVLGVCGAGDDAALEVGEQDGEAPSMVG